MGTVAYIFLAIAVLFFAWRVLTIITGLLLPIEKTGRAYFKQLIRRMELNQMVSDTLVDECVADSINYSRSLVRYSGKEKNLRTETVKQLEFRADMLRLWVRGNETFNDSPWMVEYKALFERHSVPRLGK